MRDLAVQHVYLRVPPGNASLRSLLTGVQRRSLSTLFVIGSELTIDRVLSEASELHMLASTKYNWFVISQVSSFGEPIID